MAYPQAERQVILLSAGTTERRGAMREQAERSISKVDWSRLAKTLRSRKLLPVLGPRILELAQGAVSDAFAGEVEQALEAGRRHSTFLQLTSQRVTATLAEAGIRCTPLKGPVLGEVIHGDPGRRLSNDIDLLVAPEQIKRAAEVVRSLGYARPTDYVEQDGLPLLHFALAHERGELPPVELHWRIHWYERHFAGERLLPITLDPLCEWRPAPADELAALLLFYARDGFIDLRLATDLSAWWDIYGAELPTGALDELIRTYPAFARAVPVAVKVAEKMVGLPAAQILRDMPRMIVRDRIAVRLANPNPHTSSSQLYADRGLIDGLLTPRGGLSAFVRRQVLPPREVLDEHARNAAKRRARSPLGRSVGILARYARTMTRLALPPETLRF